MCRARRAFDPVRGDHGAGLGFLWFNAPPAAVFMGDTGSLALGGALGAIAVAAHHEIVLAIVGGLFVLEAASVIIQVFFYKRTGKRVSAWPDPSPLRTARLGGIDRGDPLLDRLDWLAGVRALDAEAQMITSPAFAGKRYAVLGLARSGQATVAALLASGAHVTRGMPRGAARGAADAHAAAGWRRA